MSTTEPADNRPAGVPPYRPAGVPPYRPARPGALRLHLRTRVQPFKGADAWHEVQFTAALPVSETAILLCDVWDRHTCSAAERRLAAMVPRMNAVVGAARRGGVQVIHAPSDVIAFYAGTPQRLRVQALPRIAPPAPLDLPDPPLPIDDSDGGCDGDRLPGGPPWPWTREHPGIEIAEHDAVSADGDEVYALLRHLGIGNLVIMGVHTNMCILERGFAIKAMTRRGVRCFLVRDLTDALYNPARPPYVSHEEGTELVIQHIEKHWCPTLLSGDLAQPPV